MAAAFLAAGFLAFFAAGFLAAGVPAFLAMGFLAADFLATFFVAGFFVAVFFTAFLAEDLAAFLGVAAAGFLAFLTALCFLASLKEPLARKPLTCLRSPEATAFWRQL